MSGGMFTGLFVGAMKLGEAPETEEEEEADEVPDAARITPPVARPEAARRHPGEVILVALGNLTNLAVVSSATPDPQACRRLTDFDADDTGQWFIVNDGVMGGLSQGGPSLSGSGTLLFSGEISLENNGGFSSIRTRPANLDDLQGFIESHEELFRDVPDEQLPTIGEPGCLMACEWRPLWR